MNQHTIKPLMTEKASLLVGKNVYTFQIHQDVNKHKVTEIIENMYKVKVSHVNVAKKAGKIRRVGKFGKTKQLPDVKIAYVTLKEGKINLFPQA